MAKRTSSVFFAVVLSCALLPFGAGKAADLVITNARLFTGTNHEPIEGASITVVGNRILSISQGDVDTTGAEVIEASGKTVLPGLIDVHVHLFFDLQEEPYFPTSDSEVLSYIQTRVRGDLEEYLENGFTSILSAIDFWPQIAEVRERLVTGEFKGPRLFIGGGAFIAPGGHYICRSQEAERRQWCNQHISVPVGEADQARQAVRRYADSDVDVIVYDSLTNSPVLNDEVAAALVDEAHRWDLPVLVHNSDTDRLDSLLDAGIDGLIHPPGGASAFAVPALVRAGGLHIPIGVTIGEAEEGIRENQLSAEQIATYKQVRQNVLKLLEAGATPLFASDIPGASPRETLPIVLQSLANLGLSNAEILQASTRNAADMLRRRKDLGAVEVGKIADMIIVDGNPLQDLEALQNVQVVIKDGKVVVDKRQRSSTTNYQ